MKNILLALLFLAPWLASAFPVNTNRFTGKATDSAPPGFDAVLWQWSGYDDQYLIFEFSDVQFSNAGVRLSYPVRGATYLDYASANEQGQIATTNITTIIYETFTNCYGRVPAGTNSYAGYSNGVIVTTVNDPSLQYGDVVSLTGLVSVVGTNSINASSIPPACVVFVASNYTTFVPDYGVTTNAWIGSTSVVTNIYVYNSKKQVINDPTFSSTQQWGYSGFTYQLLYPTNATGAGSPAQGRFRAVGGGADAIRSLSQSTMAIYTSQYQVVVSYYVQQNVYNTNSVETNSITYVFADQTTTVSRVVRHTDPQPRYVSDGFYITPAVSSTPSFVMNYIATTNAQIGVDSIRVTAQAYSFVSNGVTTVTTNIIAGSNVVKTLSAGYVRNNGGYSSNTVTYYQYKVAVPRTNIPPDGLYYTEVLAYETTTNQARSLLKGQISIAHSLYANTNYATWVSPSLGRYTFLNQIEGGAQVLAGAGISVSTSGTNITIQATGTAQATDTNALPKPGGLMSGDIDFTNAGLTSLDFALFDAAPTGAVAPRRVQWNSDRSTLRLGSDANVSLDVGQQLMLYAKSAETNTLTKGEVVFVFGAAGDNPTVKRASHTSESLSARTIGIVAENIDSNNNGFVVTRGTVYNVNTTNFTEGAVLYLGANGTLQTNLPEAPLHGTFIGVVERVGANNGQIYVAVQNYQELRELSDVFINGPSNNYVLTYVAASNRWEAKAAQGGGGSGTNLFHGPATTGMVVGTASATTSMYLRGDGIFTNSNLVLLSPPDDGGQLYRQYISSTLIITNTDPNSDSEFRNGFYFSVKDYTGNENVVMGVENTLGPTLYFQKSSTNFVALVGSTNSVAASSQQLPSTNNANFSRPYQQRLAIVRGFDTNNVVVLADILDTSWFNPQDSVLRSSDGSIEWGNRFEGSVNGGWARTFGTGLDDISTDSTTNIDSYAAFLFTASTATITNTLYGAFSIPYTGSNYPLKVRANQGSGTVIFTATDGSSTRVSTQTIAAAATTYTTNVVMPGTAVTNVKVQVIMSTTNAANLYRIGIGR